MSISKDSSQHMAPRSFPSIEGNSRGARPWVETVIDWHPSGLSDTAVVQWHFSDTVKIWLMPRIFLKSRPPIGRELRILASDWSRGSPKIFKGGTLTILNLCQWIIFEDLLHCQWRSSDTVTLKWHSDTLLKIDEMRHSSQRMAPRSFPSIEGNTRGPCPWDEFL